MKGFCCPYWSQLAHLETSFDYLQEDVDGERSATLVSKKLRGFFKNCVLKTRIR